MRRAALAASILCLAGCAEWAAFRTGIAEHGAEASDEALQVAIWQICKGSPVGAILREFNTAEKRDAYEVLCKEELPVLRTASN